MNKDEIGGILTYHCKGHEKTTGQIAGMEGAGEFAIIFKGTIDSCLCLLLHFLVLEKGRKILFL